MTNTKWVMLHRNSLILIWLAPFISNVIAENVDGQVCDHCVSYEAAAIEASMQAPQVHCATPSGSSLECVSQPKNVILINLHDEIVYAFRVSREATEPFDVRVDDLPLLPERHENFMKGIHAIKAIHEGFDQIYEDWDPYSGRFIDSEPSD